MVRQLRPLHGDRITRLYHAYLAEDAEGRREIEQVLSILHSRVFPLTDDAASPLSPPPQDMARGEYPVGTVTYAGRRLCEFGLREDDWIKHILIVGASGSGKTNLSLYLIKSLLSKTKPFLVLDWKRNYRDLVMEPYGRSIRVYTPGRDVAPFRFNPLIPPPGTPAKAWLRKLIEIIAHATFVGEGVMFLLQKALDETYRAFGLYDGTPDRYPTLKDVLLVVQEMPAKGREAGWMSSTLRALGALTFGETGKVFGTRQPNDFSELLREPVVLELDALTNTDKIFLVESLLLWIHHYRLSTPGGVREQFDHAIFLEEAHHVIGKSKSDLVGGEAITDIIIREIRELGEAVVIIDQCPSLLSLPARANTWCTVTLNLKDAKDVNSAASAMLLDADRKKVIGTLEVGEAVVKLQGRWPQAFTIQIPHLPVTKGSATDALLRDLMRPYSTGSLDEDEEREGLGGIPPVETQRKIAGEERIFLQDILEHPYSGVVERYKRLKMSRRKGTTTKNILLDHGLVNTHEIPTRSGKTTILEPTRKARVALGITESKERQGGAIHEYWKHRYGEYYTSQGYRVTKEMPIGSGKSIDLVAEGPDRIAIEIETGRSDPIGNAEKCLAAGFETVILVATTEAVEAKISKELLEHGLRDDPRLRLECARRSEH
jgi:DNA helicase HerA-like ATPase